MKVQFITAISVMAATAFMFSCSSKEKVAAGERVDAPISVHAQTGATTSVSAIPKARIYKTSVDCSGFVPVQIDANGKLISFPAPTDITDQSVPLPLAGGYLLDRRGISMNSRFTTWTWREYRALPIAPLADMIKSNLLEGAYVTEVVVLPMTLDEALADTAAVNQLIVSGKLGVADPYTPVVE